MQFVYSPTKQIRNLVDFLSSTQVKKNPPIIWMVTNHLSNVFKSPMFRSRYKSLLSTNSYPNSQEYSIFTYSWLIFMANVGKWDRNLCNSRFFSCAPLVSSNLSGAVVSHDFPRFPTRKWSKVEFRSNQLKQNKTTRITFYEILSVGSQTGIYNPKKNTGFSCMELVFFCSTVRSWLPVFGVEGLDPKWDLCFFGTNQSVDVWSV